MKALQNENKYMAVSNELLEKMNVDMDEQRYENIQNRLTVSKLFLVYKKYESHFFKELKEKDLTYEDQLKWVILDILKGDIKRNIEWLIERGVDVEFLFFEVVPMVEDNEFVKMVLDRIEN